MLTLLFSMLVLLNGANTANALSESALTYKFTVAEHNWLLVHEEQAVEVMQTVENESELLAYQELIYTAKDLVNSIVLQASLIGLFILALIIFCIIKPSLIFRPLMLTFFVACIIFGVHIYNQLAILRIHSDNLRYYFLLLTS